MGRPLRIDGEGYWHHLHHRAAAGRDAFRDDTDRGSLWALLGELGERFGVEVHAVALMTTHWHAVVCSTEARLSEAMQWMLSVYTKRFNVRHGINGALFQGRFRSELIETEAQLQATVRYVHANPLDIRGVERPETYRWSSCARHAGLRDRPDWVPTEKVACLLRSDGRLSNDRTKTHRSRAAGRFPAMVPTDVVRRAVQRWRNGAFVLLPEAMRSDQRIRGPNRKHVRFARRRS